MLCKKYLFYCNILIVKLVLLKKGKRNMEKLSPLQIERLKYQPKLPESLANGINSLEMVEGSATQSVRDQEQIQNLFKNTYGKPVVTFKTSSSSSVSAIMHLESSFGIFCPIALLVH